MFSSLHVVRPLFVILFIWASSTFLRLPTLLWNNPTGGVKRVCGQEKEAQRSKKEKRKKVCLPIMSSLSGELLQLIDLFKSGALTEEEFKAAKDITIKRHGQPIETEQCRGPQPPQTAPPRQVADISGFGEDVIGRLQRQCAYDILETVVRNLRQFPNEARYRRLRCNNSKLQSQLFCVPGATTFLASLGFVASDDETDCPGDECLVLPHAPQQQLLDQALQAISYLRRREEDARANEPNYVQLRQNLRLEVRRERCEKAKAVGELRSYIAQEFSADDAGDGLYTSASNIETLRTALTNMILHPMEEKYRRLRLRNRVVYKSVVQQRGALELLVEYAGGKLVEESGESALVFRDESGATERELQYALRVLDEVEASVRAAREELRQRDYEEARRAMRAELLNARRMGEQQKRQCENEEARQVSDATKREGEGAPQLQGHRVPLKEAVKILMGKGGDSRFGYREE
ncbi:hypothetical protein, conserved [Trypanosoma brucei gambiense DAL972]|uniref:PUB domain-containing protein n=3 Tax=Trypanosoma brucei TaxID=5691 RepID=Q385D5_TRYB2|nr:hypothetical protein, conserved [Trypanosoma brucei gambiense DAL972]XP_828708.1 hypothetical protein, conserved [Trypanosoma brucei brucei TREU927]EAN79596.1 hypothetical protein, conserved [Trypanosoma brucei brucei TREU927]CBH17598.1 hypothetical protein, conserved [Trypanosoma brucei gambiense DAL972]|eukprot:XP_011779862.1 hypothetical protein, conserved [Trypanosoma brucei gambiense DAL972]